MYSHDIVNMFYQMGLFTKADVQLFVKVGMFAKEDYAKMFPDDAQTTTV